MLRNSRRRGFIKMIVIIVVALILLKYFFNISLNDILHSQIITDIWSLIKQVFSLFWQIILMVLDLLKQILGIAKTSVESLKK